MTLDRLRALLALAEVELREMGAAHPGSAVVVFERTGERDEDECSGDEVPINDVVASVECPPARGGRARKAGRAVVTLTDIYTPDVRSRDAAAGR